MSANTNTKLFNKNFILLTQGQFVSEMGTQIGGIAIALYLKHQTGSASLTTLVMMFFSLTYALFTPFGGTFADRYSRKHILVFTDLIAGLVTLFIAVVLVLDLPLPYVVVFLFAAQFVYGTAMGFFYPTINAMIPDIMSKKHLSKANSIKSGSYQLAYLMGQSVGAWLFNLFGAVAVFVINGATYLFSSASESFINLKHKPSVTKEKAEPINKKPLDQFFSEVKAGFSYLIHEKGTRNIIILLSVSYFFLGPFLGLLVFFVEDIMMVDAKWYGFILGAFGGGAAIGFVLVSTVPFSPKGRSLFILISFLIFSFCCGFFGLVKSPVLALVLYVLAGMVIGFIYIAFETAIQNIVPEELRGRVFGSLGITINGLLPVGIGLSGVVADIFNQNIPMIFAVCGACVFITTILLLPRKESLKLFQYKLND